MSRLIDADALLRRAKRVATEAWKMKLKAPIEITLNQFIDWINEAPTAAVEPHWIPVTERLPEKNGDYLCQEKLGFLYVDTWNGECWNIARSSFGIVVAWMPLPEPYKGVTK